MAQVPPSSVRVTLAQTYYLATCSDTLATRLASIANYILANISVQAPVGTIVESIMTTAQFQASRGAGWVLCNGQSCAGSAFQTLTGNSTVPDARSCTLRGKNNGRSDGNQNPDGEFSLGQNQSGNYGSHTHTNTLVNNVGGTNGTLGVGNVLIGGSYPPQAGGSLSFSMSGPQFTTAPSHADFNNVPLTETRARSTIVNYFIRIN
jgi:hypothetical protein